MEITSLIGELGDHPVIHNMERAGWPYSYDQAIYTCPRCGKDLCDDDVLLVNSMGEILGCIDGCIDEIVPDVPRLCKLCGELITDDDAVYVNAVNGDALGCSLCCHIIKIYEFV